MGRCTAKPSANTASDRSRRRSLGKPRSLAKHSSACRAGRSAPERRPPGWQPPSTSAAGRRSAPPVHAVVWLHHCHPGHRGRRGWALPIGLRKLLRLLGCGRFDGSMERRSWQAVGMRRILMRTGSGWRSWLGFRRAVASSRLTRLRSAAAWPLRTYLLAERIVAACAAWRLAGSSSFASAWPSRFGGLALRRSDVQLVDHAVDAGV